MSKKKNNSQDSFMCQNILGRILGFDSIMESKPNMFKLCLFTQVLFLIIAQRKFN